MDFSASVTALGLLVAAVVADYQAIKSKLKDKLFVVLGSAFTGLAALYVDKVVVS